MLLTPLSQDWNLLAPLVSRHRADGVLIAHARKDEDALRQRLTWIDEDGANPVLMARNVPQTWPMETLGQAVEASRTGIDEHWAAMAPGTGRSDRLRLCRHPP